MGFGQHPQEASARTQYMISTESTAQGVLGKCHLMIMMIHVTPYILLSKRSRGTIIMNQVQDTPKKGAPLRLGCGAVKGNSQTAGWALPRFKDLPSQPAHPAPLLLILPTPLRSSFDPAGLS